MFGGKSDARIDKVCGILRRKVNDVLSTKRRLNIKVSLNLLETQLLLHFATCSGQCLWLNTLSITSAVLVGSRIFTFVLFQILI
jgi:hypothetical protein